jgi:hypothetical protein
MSFITYAIVTYMHELFTKALKREENLGNSNASDWDSNQRPQGK